MLSEETTSQSLSKQNEKINLSFNGHLSDDIIKTYIPEIIEIDQTKLKEFGVVLDNVTARWSKQNVLETLQNVNIHFQPGQLSVIIGPVGSGKVITVACIAYCTCQ